MELRELILASARAEFQYAGYSGATTAAIARGAGVTETQLFRMFQSKAALFRAAVFEPLDDAFAVFNDARFRLIEPGKHNSLPDTQAYIADLMAFIEANREMLVPLLAAQLVDGGQVEGVAGVGGLRTYFDLGSAHLAHNTRDLSKQRSDTIVRVSFAAVLAVVLFRDWLFPSNDGDEAAMSAALADFFVNGLGVSR
ncbi:TetR/AcrR family transcriptional regulator [Novosphingobium sp. 9U]|uniref:TetR/AcrR family transcriptional regulator n=1 Tax=Novosphingobium sp. 9U TaxID=2653158 RepID=UPI001F261754|nr:TetR/AcrR family transcriptional regulator [Novosphingobium sp. 9U]